MAHRKYVAIGWMVLVLQEKSCSEGRLGELRILGIEMREMWEA